MNNSIRESTRTTLKETINRCKRQKPKGCNVEVVQEEKKERRFKQNPLKLAPIATSSSTSTTTLAGLSRLQRRLVHHSLSPRIQTKIRACGAKISCPRQLVQLQTVNYVYLCTTSS